MSGRAAALSIGGAAALLFLAGCGAGGPAARSPANVKRPAPASAPAGPAMTVGGTASSAVQLSTMIGELYAAHANLRRFVVQGTTYSPRSRRVVFGVCTAGGTREMTENAQTSRLDACAPMIFYFYKYGVQRGVPTAIELADDLLAYAVNEVRGPLNSESVIAGTLRGWGIRVDTNAFPQASQRTPPAVTQALAETNTSILAERSVRVTILGRKRGVPGLAERLVVDMGERGAHEVITEPDAHAQILITPNAAFLSGDRQGLTRLLGLTTVQAKRAGSSWIRAGKGSQEYADLEAETTITALPSSILPAASASVTMATRSDGGQAVRVLTWHAADGSSADLTERLELTGGTRPLPRRETTQVAGYRQTATFSNWSEAVAPSAPPANEIVSYASLGGP